jgi:hypothetical protein
VLHVAGSHADQLPGNVAGITFVPFRYWYRNGTFGFFRTAFQLRDLPLFRLEISGDKRILASSHPNLRVPGGSRTRNRCLTPQPANTTA